MRSRAVSLPSPCCLSAARASPSSTRAWSSASRPSGDSASGVSLSGVFVSSAIGIPRGAVLPVGAAAPPPLGSRFRGNDGTEVSAPCGHRRLCPARQTAGVSRTRHSVLQGRHVMARRAPTPSWRRGAPDPLCRGDTPHTRHSRGSGNPCWVGLGRVAAATPPPLGSRFRGNDGTEVSAPCGYRRLPPAGQSAPRPGPVMARRPRTGHAAATRPTPVIPAEAGIHAGWGWGVLLPCPHHPWVPAFAGMTEQRFPRHVSIDACPRQVNPPRAPDPLCRDAPAPVMPRRRPPHPSFPRKRESMLGRVWACRRRVPAAPGFPLSRE